jgi:hypothetical protein
MRGVTSPAPEANTLDRRAGEEEPLGDLRVSSTIMSSGEVWRSPPAALALRTVATQSR